MTIDKDTGEIFTVEDVPKPAPFIRTAHNYDRREASMRSALYCDDPSLAQQHAKDDADINVLVKRYGITNQLPVLDRVPLQGDFTEIGDYQSALNAVIAAQRDFQSLPAEVRKEFDNDPQRFLEFTSDEKNKEKNMEKLKEWKLLKPQAAPPAPIEVRLAKEPEATPPAT